jgi:hypothetical protein
MTTENHLFSFRIIVCELNGRTLFSFTMTISTGLGTMTLAPNNACSFTKKRLLLDLRNGIGYALTRLSLLSDDVDHLVVRQSTPLFAGLRVTDEDLVDIFQAIGVLSNLRALAISDFDEIALPAVCLVELLRNSSGLQALKLDSIRISGDRDAFDDLAAALICHPSLQEIYFSGCVPSEESMATLEPIASAIAKIQTLEVVEIVETTFPPSGAWTGVSLGELCQSESLKVLRVRGVRFLGDQDIQLMAQALQNNKAMKELWILSCELGFAGVGSAALARMLRVNTSLEILGLNRLCFNDQAIALADALKENSTLRGLHLCLRDGLSSKRKIAESFAELMEDNYVLQTMSGFYGGDQVEFYLRLNQNGRRNLLQNSNSSKKQWLDALCSQSDDVSALFYLLSRNPSLCKFR